MYVLSLLAQISCFIHWFRFSCNIVFLFISAFLSTSLVLILAVNWSRSSLISFFNVVFTVEIFFDPFFAQFLVDTFDFRFAVDLAFLMGFTRLVTFPVDTFALRLAFACIVTFVFTKFCFFLESLIVCRLLKSFKHLCNRK
uniref:Uncharacterized protein n=1 Tax=Cacopsylla melanoneura TaxID=428564 RepID=A0A8D8QL21_9HEMI